MSEHEDVGVQVAQWIAQQLSDGRRRPDIEEELVEAGMNRDTASQLVGAVQEKMRSERVKRGVMPWVVVIVGFLAINGILYGVQEIASADDREALAELEIVMDSLDNEIDRIEAEAQFSQPTPQVEAYYYRLVDEYNSLVPEYNELAESAYSRWWLLPIPAPRGRGGGAASR